MGCVSSSETTARPNAQAKPATKGPATKGFYSKYERGVKLGEGGFGVVFECALKGTQDFRYAVKMVDKVEAPMEDIQREVNMLQKLQHESVVQIRDAYFEKIVVCIVLDKYTGGDMIAGLQTHWKSEGPVPCAKASFIVWQMSRSIVHLHSNGIVHRDIKGDNYLMDRKSIVDPELRILLSDFGTAIEVKPSERITNKCGTTVYWSPEFYDRNYSFKVDIWALGVVVYGILEGRFPFKDEKQVRDGLYRSVKSATPEAKDFVRQIFRPEKERLDAEGVMNHSWVKDSTRVPSSNDAKQSFSAGEEPEGLRESGANAGVVERREVLLERIEKAKKKHAQAEKAFKVGVFWESRLIVQNKNTASEMRYEWWEADRVEREKVIDLSNAALGHGDTAGEIDGPVIMQTLREHGIDVATWGTGQARSFDEFAAEVRSGTAELMLDATAHKQLVRVSNVVLVRISCQVAGTVRYLVEESESFQDGRTRPDLRRLPGRKREPHENSKQTAERLLGGMDMGDCQVVLDFGAREVFEEQEVSISYPGVNTVYRKEIIPGKVTTTDASVLKRIGAIAQVCRFEAVDDRGLGRDLCWYDDAECQTKSIRLHAPAEDEDVSGIVQAPIGFGESELLFYLQSNGVDTTVFGKGHNKSIKDFSVELQKGESSIMVKPDGGVVRVVDVVLLRLTRQGESKVLVEKEEKLIDGTVKPLRRLPGMKRRPDENQFLAAQRLIRKELKMDDNYVTIDAEHVAVLEESGESPSYPGINTLYRKRVISAELQKTVT